MHVKQYVVLARSEEKTDIKTDDSHLAEMRGWLIWRNGAGARFDCSSSLSQIGQEMVETCHEN